MDYRGESNTLSPGRSACTQPVSHYIPSMETLIVQAFKKWCRQNVPRGEKTCEEHAVRFYVSLGHEAGSDDWKMVHGVLRKAKLI